MLILFLSQDGFTALHLACSNGDKDIAEILMETGSLACSSGQKDIAEILMETGRGTEAQDNVRI